MKIGKSNLPASAVKNRLLKLDPFDIIKAVNQIVSSGKSETITRNYILTVLYQIHDQERLNLAKDFEAYNNGEE